MSAVSTRWLVDGSVGQSVARDLVVTRRRWVLWRHRSGLFRCSRGCGGGCRGQRQRLRVRHLRFWFPVGGQRVQGGRERRQLEPEADGQLERGGRSRVMLHVGHVLQTVEQRGRMFLGLAPQLGHAGRTMFGADAIGHWPERLDCATAATEPCGRVKRVLWCGVEQDTY